MTKDMDIQDIRAIVDCTAYGAACDGSALVALQIVKDASEWVRIGKTEDKSNAIDLSIICNGDATVDDIITIFAARDLLMEKGLLDIATVDVRR